MKYGDSVVATVKEFLMGNPYSIRARKTKAMVLAVGEKLVIVKDLEREDHHFLPKEKVKPAKAGSSTGKLL